MRRPAGNPGRRLAWLAAWLGVVLAAAGAELPGSFAADCAALGAGPHRLAGTTEGAAASAFVEKRLREIVGDGADGAKVIVQEFPTLQTEVVRCELEVGGRTLPLLPMRPNGQLAPLTPPEGLKGNLLYAGHGELAEYGARSPLGRIVVLDFEAGSNWLTAFQLGAKAVIFVPGKRFLSTDTHSVEATTNLPRFYYDGPASDLMEGEPAVVKSEVRWTSAVGRNVLAYLPGTAPEFDLGQPEVVVIAARLDSFGEVPRLAPGARQAANVAGLLYVAECLRKAPPRRNVVIACFDQEARGHLGVSAFYRALEEKVKDVFPAKRLALVEEEAAFGGRLTELVAAADPFGGDDAELRKALIRRVTPKADEHVFELTHELQVLRIGAAKLAADSPQLTTARERITALEADKAEWNNVRRVLGRDALTDEAIGKVLEERRKRMEEEKRPKPEDHLQMVKTRLRTALDEVGEDLRIRRGEVELERRALQADTALREAVGAGTIVLHMSLLLGDGTSRWGVIAGGDSFLHSWKDSPGLYANVQKAAGMAAAELGEAGAPLTHFMVETADGSLSPVRQMWAAPRLVHSGEIAGLFGIYNVAVATAQDPLPREGTPADTLAALDMAAMGRQVEEVARWAPKLLDEAPLSQRRTIERDVRYVWPKYDAGRFRGTLAMGRSRGSAMPNKPMPHAVVMLRKKLPMNSTYPTLYQGEAWPAFDNQQLVMCNQQGAYMYGPVAKSDGAYMGFAITTDEYGAVTFASSTTALQKPYERLNMFACREGAVVLPPQVSGGFTEFMDGVTNSRLEKDKSFTDTRDGVALWFCEEKVDVVKLFGLKTTVALANGPAQPVAIASNGPLDDQAVTGEGLPLTPRWQFPSSAATAATDLWRLDESRLAVLRARNVANSSVEELHARAEDLLDKAGVTTDQAARFALYAEAFLGQSSVYSNVRQSFDDLIHAVLVLLALSVPFAFALERLLIGSVTIYRQIAWFVGFFAATFVLLFISHPAFAISKTPIVIFLGFTIVVLSTLVIVIIMRKFEVELKILQGLESTVHAADVSRFGTVVAAMNMGISSMRRRPLRTALSAVTIILLTFTILCFASFDFQKGIVRRFVQPSPPYAGAYVHQVNWGALTPSLYELMQGRWQEEATLCPRYWISPRNANEPGPLLSLDDATEPLALRGVLGVQAAELGPRADLRKLLGNPEPGDFADGIWLTKPVADRLGVQPGSKVRLAGRPLRVVRVLDPIQLTLVKDMDGSDIVPVDFQEVSSSTPDLETAIDAASEENWATLPIDSVVIVGAATAQRLGAKLHAMTLYTKGPEEAIALGEQLARVLPLPISATRTDGVYKHVLGRAIKASGAKDLLFPVLLGGLVIFGTMLGSVADRQKEIYTFSALGLAPQHVAGLFLAEAMVYSVVGGLGGYLFAQGSLKVMDVLASHGLMRVPEINYSSVNAIVTILLVMVTVLVSSIYPAVKASRSANPGVMRSWKIPDPDGDVMHIVFPFTVSGYDITGVVSFLKEHFDNFSDTGLGIFMAHDTKLVSFDGLIGLRSRIALAPFDLGVTQDFELRSAASEIPGIDEVTIMLTRRSGQPKDWQRQNKVLLDDLRRQFLIWRSLAPETMELYRERTLAAMGGGEAEG